MGLVYRLDFSNGKSYIGLTTVGMRERLRGHAKSVRLGSTFLVHQAWRKYGVPKHAIVGYAEGDALAALEIETIAACGTLEPAGYNQTPGGYCSPAKSPSVASKISATLKRVGMPRHVQEMGWSAVRGKPLSEEHRAKMSVALKGRPACEKALEAARRARIGSKHTEETKRRIALKKVGQRQTDEGRARIAAANRGKVVSQETRDKISHTKRARSLERAAVKELR